MPQLCEMPPADIEEEMTCSVRACAETSSAHPLALLFEDDGLSVSTWSREWDENCVIPGFLEHEEVFASS
jgi:hypothetical protein